MTPPPNYHHHHDHERRPIIEVDIVTPILRPRLPRIPTPVVVVVPNARPGEYRPADCAPAGYYPAEHYNNPRW